MSDFNHLAHAREISRYISDQADDVIDGEVITDSAPEKSRLSMADSTNLHALFLHIERVRECWKLIRPVVQQIDHSVVSKYNQHFLECGFTASLLESTLREEIEKRRHK